MVGLILMRHPIVEVLFQHGRFNAASTALTTWALWLYALGLPWFAISKILVPAYYSTQDMRTPVKVAALCMVTNIVLNLLLLRPLLNGGPALSTSLSGVLNAVILYKVFIARHGDIGWRRVRAALGRILVASAGMGMVVWGALQVASFTTRHALWWRALLLALVLALATGVYFGLAWLMHCEELSDIYGIARRRKTEVPPFNVG
jgi:putative peptidoglycan lipid II flippase